VLAPDFELLFPPSANVYPVPDLFVALRIDFDKADRQFAFLRVIGRMKPGVSAEMVSVQAEQVATDLRERFPIKKAADLHFYVVPMHQDLVAHVRPTINALMGAAFFVLLIACANVANLLLVRAMARKREVAIRAALGSSPARLVSHMLGESIVLAACGALLGLVLAWAGIKLLIAFAPANLPRLNDVRIDPVVLGFFFLAGVLTLALFGALPAIRASRPNIAGLLRAGGQTPGLHDGRKLRNIVVVTEVALSLVLLVGCGLMVRSFVALQQVDPGYAPSGVLTFQAPNAFAQTSEVSSAYARRLQERLSALPGVKAVTAARPFPLDGRVSSVRWGTAAAAENPSKFQQANVHFVLPGYFEAMHTRLIAGRTFTQDDNRDSAMVVVVDRLLAAKAFPGESAVGKRLLVRFRAPEPEWLEVIGVVEHQRHESLAKEGRETLFLTDGFFGHGTVDTWAVRTIGNPSDLVPAVRAAVAEVEPRVAVFDVQPMQSLVDHAMAPMRFALVLISVFAAVAVLLAAVGLYGVLSTSVRQRTAEIGLRIAIGAPAHSILGLIIGEGVKLSVAGIVLGLGAAFVLTRLIRSLLYGIAPTDPATFAVVVLLFLWIAVLASWLPARRAARLPPTTALRDE
jgi:putative ABC transport system permease protein